MKDGQIVRARKWFKRKWFRLSIVLGCALGVGAIIILLLGSSGLALLLGVWSIAIFGTSVGRFFRIGAGVEKGDRAP